MNSSSLSTHRLVQSQLDDIKTLVDSHKHLQMQNSVSLGAIMGTLNIPLHALPEAIRPKIPTPVILPANKPKGEIEARLLKSSIQTQKDKSKETV